MAEVGFPSRNSVTRVFWLSLRANGQRLVMTVIRHIAVTQTQRTALLLLTVLTVGCNDEYDVYNIHMYWYRLHFTNCKLLR